MIRIGFSGAPGSGKTSTARALATSCRKDLKNVELIYEYARRYISKHGSIDNVWEQYIILEKQIEWEESVTNSSLDIMITDCPVFVGFAYTIDLRKENGKDLYKENMVINDLFKKMNCLNYPPRYDIVFHIPPELEPVDDGVRPPSNFDPEWRNKMDGRLRFVFDLFPPKQFVVVDPVDLQGRIDFCLECVRMHKNDNCNGN